MRTDVEACSDTILFSYSRNYFRPAASRSTVICWRNRPYRAARSSGSMGKDTHTCNKMVLFFLIMHELCLLTTVYSGFWLKTHGLHEIGIFRRCDHNSKSVKRLRAEFERAPDVSGMFETMNRPAHHDIVRKTARHDRTVYRRSYCHGSPRVSQRATEAYHSPQPVRPDDCNP